jgi:hypothetical protein
VEQKAEGVGDAHLKMYIFSLVARYTYVGCPEPKAGLYLALYLEQHVGPPLFASYSYYEPTTIV